MSKKILLIDIDGTVSEDIPNEEPHRFKDAKVIEGALEWVNLQYEQGHRITFSHLALKNIEK